MPTKTIRFQPELRSAQHGRTFEIRVRSDVNGYEADVLELLYGGGTAPIDLPSGPRLEIPPSSFFRMREYYRGMLASDLMSEIRHGTVTRLHDSASQSTYYIRANLSGWPRGYPDAVGDDMAAWLSE